MKDEIMNAVCDKLDLKTDREKELVGVSIGVALGMLAEPLAHVAKAANPPQQLKVKIAWWLESLERHEALGITPWADELHKSMAAVLAQLSAV